MSLYFYLPFLTEDRNSILPTILCRTPNMYAVQNLMNTVNKRKLLQLCKFIITVLYHVKNRSDYLFSLLFLYLVFVSCLCLRFLIDL